MRKRIRFALVGGMFLGTLIAWGCSQFHTVVIEPASAVPLVQPQQFQVFHMRHDYDA